MNSHETHPDGFAHDVDPIVSHEAPRAQQQIAEPQDVEAEKRPRVALMGEFSAGKSTLSNLLLGASALPVNVTATQLPPVWISKGSRSPYTVSTEGDEQEINLEELEKVSVEGTSHIRVFHEADRLSQFDLIDMPGISDPNMAADVWQRMIHHADVVIWCSHATQAWRQSEAAVWGTMPKELYDRSVLLLTRMDKILSERDQGRVIKRVESETKGLFRKVLPASLIKALSAREGSDVWAQCGATDLVSEVNALVAEVSTGERRAPVNTENGTAVAHDAVDTPKARPARIVMPTRVRPRPLES